MKPPGTPHAPGVGVRRSHLTVEGLAHIISCMYHIGPSTLDGPPEKAKVDPDWWLRIWGGGGAQRSQTGEGPGGGHGREECNKGHQPLMKALYKND